MRDSADKAAVQWPAHDTTVQRLAAIVESSDDAIISKDLNSIIQTWNRGAEQMFGYTAAEAVGQSIRLIIPSDRQAEEADVLRRIRAGDRVDHFETVRQRKDGTPVEISLSVSPIRLRTGEIVGASKIARDISEPRRLFRELEHTSRMKDEFLATLSHELRTPLNAILGYARMMRTGVMGPDRSREAADVIERNAHALNQLVADVLDISKIVSGKTRMTPQRADVRKVIESAIDVVRPPLDAKGVSLRIDMPATPIYVYADPDRLQQVLWNLLVNAVKFTPSGGAVSVIARPLKDAVEIEVADTGAGIASEFLPHVFERFRQADSSTTREYRGLGLGLALVRHFIDLHGGMVRGASPGIGHGATFTVTLPRLE